MTYYDRWNLATLQLGKAEAKIAKAVELIDNYGGIDGDHHKQWVLDQVVQELLGPEEYARFCADRVADGYSEWDPGIAP